MDVSQIDQQTISDINGIVESRRLSQADARRLVNFIAGAVRPNRDRPVFDLCRVLSVAAVATAPPAGKPGAGKPDRCLAAILGPSRAVAAMVAGKAPMQEIGALLGFAEFLLTHDDCSYYGDMSRIITALAAAGEAGREVAVKEAVAAIASRLRSYRTERFPVARHEKVFRSLLSFLGARGKSRSVSSFDDEDVVSFWESEIKDGNRVLYRTVVKHFLTLETVASDLAAQRALNDAMSLYDEGEGGRIIAPVETATEGVVDTGDPQEARFEALLEFLQKGLPDGIKLLTGTERERLVDLLECGPFTSSRPLTALRYISFGAVQSGIANFLRRGSGGDTIAARVTCADAASYPEVGMGYGKLSDHLERLLLISAFLSGKGAPANDTGDIAASVSPEALQQAQREGAQFLKRLKREGLEAPPEELAPRVLPIAGQLVGIREVVKTFLSQSSGLNRSAPLDQHFARDRSRFASALSQAYVENAGADGRTAKSSRAEP